jgi:hypothetical protein
MHKVRGLFQAERFYAINITAKSLPIVFEKWMLA